MVKKIPDYVFDQIHHRLGILEKSLYRPPSFSREDDSRHQFCEGEYRMLQELNLLFTLYNEEVEHNGE